MTALNFVLISELLMKSNIFVWRQREIVDFLEFLENIISFFNIFLEILKNALMPLFMRIFKFVLSDIQFLNINGVEKHLLFILDVFN
jgi:hypothetical protein